jgi:hypothetical protein
MTTGRGTAPRARPARFAPVELAPAPQLQAAAAAAPTVRRLRALVEWLDEGRKLTAAGNLTLADGNELARLLGLVDPDRPSSVRVRSAQHIAGLELWSAGPSSRAWPASTRDISYRSSSTGTCCSTRRPWSCPKSIMLSLIVML